MTKSLTTGVHHVGLSLSDIEAAKEFFTVGLGYEHVGSVPDYPAHFVSDGSTLITLWQVGDPSTAHSFDRKNNVGLHHLAIGVADEGALSEVYNRVSKWPSAEIEFDPCPIREGSATRHFMCSIPGGARVEFVTPFG
ncbi:MAG: VOC family protein [Parasphingorhabdus sp.]